MIPSVELFDRLYIYSEDQGYSTFDRLPRLDEPYPFVVIGDAITTPGSFKDAEGGTISITIHVWGNQDMRNEVNDMLANLTRIGSVETQHYRFQTRLNDSQTEIVEDNSVENTELLHGVGTLFFDIYSKKERTA